MNFSRGFLKGEVVVVDKVSIECLVCRKVGEQNSSSFEVKEDNR